MKTAETFIPKRAVKGSEVTRVPETASRKTPDSGTRASCPQYPTPDSLGAKRP